MSSKGKEGESEQSIYDVYKAKGFSSEIPSHGPGCFY